MDVIHGKTREPDALEDRDLPPASRDKTRELRGIRFAEKGGLIYYYNEGNGTERLCIPKAMIYEVPHQAHNANFHIGVDCTHARLLSSFYILNMRKRPGDRPPSDIRLRLRHVDNYDVQGQQKDVLYARHGHAILRAIPRSF
ncbi:hypothetical protein P154DRAFT_538608 [Amniculicola lignicola CBS 123094]|uniref:Uncharacterized protein n=1 Tax=Amniculicola lignicola CBS 123094 TaxID=1392246 RepID=A0A6A5W3K2_9PLEO|nr:hypothetical protein P154DRAFT_538608 [Amniculicola lignicola CBS 123094]